MTENLQHHTFSFGSNAVRFLSLSANLVLAEVAAKRADNDTDRMATFRFLVPGFKSIGSDKEVPAGIMSVILQHDPADYDPDDSHSFDDVNVLLTAHSKGPAVHDAPYVSGSPEAEVLRKTTFNRAAELMGPCDVEGFVGWVVDHLFVVAMEPGERRILWRSRDLDANDSWSGS